MMRTQLSLIPKLRILVNKSDFQYKIIVVRRRDIDLPGTIAEVFYKHINLGEKN